MSYQIGLPPKTCFTLITLVRLGVNLLVNSLVTGSSEGLGTMFANKVSCIFVYIFSMNIKHTFL